MAGETYRQYLLSLFDDDPLSGHSALETLIRILREGLIRAGSRLDSGKCGGSLLVFSFSEGAVRVKEWNRALVRWTVEPYGIAVRRDILRSLGAKPVIYGSDGELTPGLSKSNGTVSS